MISFNRKLIAGLALVCGFALSLPAQAEVNFAGKTIEWNIPFSEKGGSAKWANFFAPLLSEALPGNPTVVVKYRPGAGSTKGANWFHKQKVKDGTVIFGTSGSTHFPYLLGDKRVKYEIRDWIPVMATGTGGVAYLNANDGAKFDGSANMLKGGDHIFGSQGATRLDLIPLLAFKMLGMNVEPVFGIKSRGDGRLMFERGEATVDYQTSAAYLKASVELVKEGKAIPMMTWGSVDVDGNIIRDPTFPDLPTFKEGKAIPMMTWGSVDADGNIIRDPTFPDMPTFKEVCEKTSGCDTSGDSFQAWKGFFNAGFPVQKIVFLPNGTDPEIVATFANAFAKVRARSDFEEISAKRLGKYPMFVGPEAAAGARAATSVPASAKKFVIDWLNSEYGTKL